MDSDILRDKFLSFFKARKHRIEESDSLVPKEDSTVLFTPAGMNQFKKHFLGVITDFSRAATCQRCLRTDDLDHVGKTAAHHTLFEMLGNFSFGDYFKEESIAWAWEFLTKELKIEEKRLWVSVYKDDDEAYDIWKDKIKIPLDKIVKLGDKDNFWPAEAKAKGPNGPCGPCSEIFFDMGKNFGCGKDDCSPACSCGRFVEVWNLVFTQFNRKEGGILEPLPKKNIDTGMGLERLAAVMQGVYSNFETDLFIPIIKEIRSVLKPQVRDNSVNKELIYAVADHLRAVSFAIYDGVLPSNEARGYIVRKLIRKSILHLRTLDIKKPFLYRLVPVLSEIMKAAYPQLDSRRENIADIILAEEKSFISTLETSGNLLKSKFKELSVKRNPQKAGVIAFQLYDTYGIPWELTIDWLRKHNIEISREVFDRELEEQKVRSKSQSVMKGDVFGSGEMILGVKETKFLGYKETRSDSKISGIIKNNLQAKKISKGEEAEIILDKTVFYAESGGQVGDQGVLTKGKNIFEVLNTRKSGKVIIHSGRVKEGNFKLSDEVTAEIDLKRRLSISRNHTATHLLQAALRKILGVHIQQQGSLVAEDRLRFDFTHFKNIEKSLLDRIEEEVNNFILGSHSVDVKQMPLTEAKKSGALAFFAEKYEKQVRVVKIADLSKEFCGGTHLSNTSQIGGFKIVQEGAVASGVRRIEAVTGSFAYKLNKEQEDIIAALSSLLGVPAEKLLQEIEKRLLRIKELENQLNSGRWDRVKSCLESFIENAEEINGIKVIARQIDNLDMDTLRKAVDLIKQKINNAVVILGSSAQGKALLVMGITEDACQKGMDASKIIRELSKILGGSGGGRRDFAQAGGIYPENFQKAFQEFKNLLSGMK